MPVAVCVELDFQTGPLGLASQLHNELRGKSVLRRLAERTLAVEGAADRIFLVRPAEEGPAQAALAGLPVKIVRRTEEHPSRQRLLRRARKFSRDSWRGGMLQSVAFDEETNFAALARVAREGNYQALLAVSSHAALCAPEILEGMLQRYRAAGQELRRGLYYLYTQAPPGLAGEIYARELLEQAAKESWSPCDLLKYEPGKTSLDPAHRENNYLLPTPVRRIPARLSADSRRSLELLEALLSSARADTPRSPSAEEMARLIWERPSLLWRFPRQVEVELTTDCTLACTDSPCELGRENRGRLARRLFEKLLAELSAYDDLLLTLGGWGEPLLHPELFDFIRLARERGIYGLHLATTGVELSEEFARRLLECDVDVVSVRLGAFQRESYRRLRGRDALEVVTSNLRRLVALRRERGQNYPLLVPCIEKIREVEPEIESFYDYWLREADWPVIRPFNNYAGQIADRATIPLTLAARQPCEKLRRELFVFADGRVSYCRQDFAAREPISNLNQDSLAALWAKIMRLRQEHENGRYDGFPLCKSCRDWDHL